MSEHRRPAGFAMSGPISILLGSALLVGGCAKRGGIDRLPISGAVSCPVGSVVNGSITFLPAAGRPGPAATTGVVEGRYRFDRASGPTAGPHTVIVNRLLSKRQALEVRNARDPKNSAVAGDARKMQWTLSIDLKDDGVYKCNLTLSP